MFGFKPRPPRDHVPSPDDNFDSLVASMNDRYLPIGIADFTLDGQIDSRLVICHTQFDRDEDDKYRVVFHPELLLYVPTNFVDGDKPLDFHLCEDEQKTMQSGKYPDYHIYLDPKHGDCMHIECVGQFSLFGGGLGDADEIEHGRYVGYEPLTRDPQLSYRVCNMLGLATFNGSELRELVGNLKKVNGLGESAARMEFSRTKPLESTVFRDAICVCANKQGDELLRMARGVNDKFSGKYELYYRPISFYDAATIANTPKNAALVCDKLNGTYILGLMGKRDNNQILSLKVVARPNEYSGEVDLSDSRLITSEVLPVGEPLSRSGFLAYDKSGDLHAVVDRGDVSARTISSIQVLPHTIVQSGRMMEAVVAFNNAMNGAANSTIYADEAWLLARVLNSGSAKRPKDVNTPVRCGDINDCIQLAEDRNREREESKASSWER